MSLILLPVLATDKREFHQGSGSRAVWSKTLAFLVFLQFLQNHRMVGVARDLWGPSSPTPLPKQDHVEQAAHDLVQAGFEYLQRRRLHSLSGKPIPVLCHSQSKEVLLSFVCFLRKTLK